MNDTDTTTSSVSSSTTRRRKAGPDFEFVDASAADNLIDEVIPILINENIEALEHMRDDYGIYMTTKSVEYIFTICARLNLPDPVRFHALDLFDRYMIKQTRQMHDVVAELNESDAKKFELWEATEARLSRQLTLRMLSAIQIASKLHSFHDSLSKPDVKKCLTALGFAHTIEAIQKSELRMLEMLDWKLQSRRSPAIFVENFLKLLVRFNPVLQPDVDAIYQYSLFCLDCCFLNRDEIYTYVLRIVGRQKPVPITEERIRRVQSDFVLMACGAIIVAILCTHSPEVAHHNIETLSFIGNISNDDISDFVNGFLKVYITDDDIEEAVEAAE